MDFLGYLSLSFALFIPIYVLIGVSCQNLNSPGGWYNASMRLCIVPCCCCILMSSKGCEVWGPSRKHVRCAGVPKWEWENTQSESGFEVKLRFDRFLVAQAWQAQASLFPLRSPDASRDSRAADGRGRGRTDGRTDGRRGIRMSRWCTFLPSFPCHVRRFKVRPFATPTLDDR